MGRESERTGGTGLRHPASRDHAGNQQNHAEDTRPSDLDLSGMTLEHPKPHDERDRNRHADGKDAPRAIRKRVHHYYA